MTKPRRYKRFSSEFMKMAILRAAEPGMTDNAVCEELGVGARHVDIGRKKYRDKQYIGGSRL